jgi:o-succinylbenzoate---CoA ligase
VSSLRPVHGPARELLSLLREWNAVDAEPEPLLIETSGSTGSPKRVALSRAAMRSSARATHARLGGPGQWLLNLPASYVAGVQVLFRSVLSGTEPVLLDEHEDFASAATALSASRRYVSLVPTQLVRMLDVPAEAGTLASFDAVLVGGAALDPWLRRAAHTAGVPVVATYGMSETCGGCVYDGVPLDGVRVAVRRDGRIRITGATLFSGYQGDPRRTGQVLEDGWFLTSDYGRFDDWGALEVLGRIDDVVVSGGVKVPAPAVAQRLRGHPRVAAAEVVGIPDTEWGHQVVALVVASASAGDPSLEDLRDWVAQELPRSWAPRRLVAITTVPLLSNGKVDRRTLEAIAARSRASAPR